MNSNHIACIGEELEREYPELGDEAASNSFEVQQPCNPAVNNSNRSEDLRLIMRARAVGLQYEFAQHGVVETEPDWTKRQRRNQRRITNEERRLRDAVGDLPPPPQGPKLTFLCRRQVATEIVFSVAKWKNLVAKKWFVKFLLHSEKRKHYVFKNVPVRLACIKALYYHTAYISVVKEFLLNR